MMIFAFLVCIVSVYSNSNDTLILEQSRKFQNILTKIDRHYVDSVDIIKLSDNAFKAILQSLDKQSYYFTQEEYLKLKNQTTGVSKIGIGIEVINLKDTNIIWNILRGSPAESSGLKIGDKLLFIDGESVIGDHSDKINEYINGLDSTIANIIYRSFEDFKLNEVSIKRKSTPVSSIKNSFRIQNSKTAYLKIGSFTTRTEKELLDSINSLEPESLDYLIIDLRNNNGGVMEQAANAVSLFLDSNLLITKTKSLKNQENEEIIYSKGGKKFKNFAICVLINEGSASAAEIFAGAIQDYDRGIVLGEISFGKGSVQRAWEFTDSTAYRMTISRWTTPMGRPVELLNNNDIDLKNSSQEIKGLEKIISKFGGNNKLDLYSTSKGRKMIAINGIYPDVQVNSDTLTLLTKTMIQNKVFEELTLSYFDFEKYQKFKKNYKDYINFFNDFKVDKEILDILAKILVEKNTFNKEMYDKDLNFIFNRIKAKFAEFIWGINAFYYIDVQIDKQIIEAVKNMNVAKEMIK